jgi:predicted XRE-type DNA-binding protein
MAFKNVFLAMGFAHDEATIEAWRSDLARIIRAEFDRSGKSQVAFAQQLGIKQSVLSPIVNSNLSRVSVEFLLKLCVRLGTAGEARWSDSAESALVKQIPAGHNFVQDTGTTRMLAIDVDGWADISRVGKADDQRVQVFISASGQSNSAVSVH